MVTVEDLNLLPGHELRRHRHHLLRRDILLDLRVEPAAGQKLTLGAAPRALGKLRVEVPLLRLQLSLALAHVVHIIHGVAVLRAHRGVVILAAEVIVVALAVGEDEIDDARLRVHKDGLGDPPVATLIVEP